MTVKTLRRPADLADAGLVAPERLPELERVAARYAVSISPAMAALIEPSAHDPIALSSPDPEDFISIRSRATIRSATRHMPVPPRPSLSDRGAEAGFHLSVYFRPAPPRDVGSIHEAAFPPKSSRRRTPKKRPKKKLGGRDHRRRPADP